MVLELIATVLLLHGCSSNSLNSVYADSNASSDNHIVEKLDTPSRAYIDYHIGGIYNYRHQVDFTDANIDDDYSIVFEDISNNGYWYSVPIYIADNMYYLYKLDFLTNPTDSRVEIVYNVYSEVAWVGTYTDIVLDDYLDEDMDYSSVYFDVRVDVGVLSEYGYNLFNLIFTHDDNAFVTTYTGYYSFVNNLSSINQSVGVLGYIMANTSIYYGFSNAFNGVSTSSLKFMYYDLETQHYYQRSYSLPFDSNSVIFNNMLFNGVKMSNQVKSRLSSVGIFQYVRDNSFDDESLPDLLLTIADIPVYFISQFLNFELFGFNLFVALASLVTLLVVIFVVRKLF